MDGLDAPSRARWPRGPLHPAACGGPWGAIFRLRDGDEDHAARVGPDGAPGELYRDVPPGRVAAWWDVVAFVRVDGAAASVEVRERRGTYTVPLRSADRLIDARFCARDLLVIVVERRGWTEVDTLDLETDARRTLRTDIGSVAAVDVRRALPHSLPGVVALLAIASGRTVHRVDLSREGADVRAPWLRCDTKVRGVAFGKGAQPTLLVSDAQRVDRLDLVPGDGPARTTLFCGRYDALVATNDDLVAYHARGRQRRSIAGPLVSPLIRGELMWAGACGDQVFEMRRVDDAVVITTWPNRPTPIDGWDDPVYPDAPVSRPACGPRGPRGPTAAVLRELAELVDSVDL
jgi:hypothetical protein